jgi:hypothetical protein
MKDIIFAKQWHYLVLKIGHKNIKLLQEGQTEEKNQKGI